MKDIQEQLHQLVTLYGPERVRTAAKKLLDASLRPIPAEYIPILSPDKLEKTMLQLDAALYEITKAGEAKEAIYQDKANLVRQQTNMEVAIKLAEADAFMLIEGEGRDQYVMENGKKVPLNNDSARDAFRRRASAEERRQAVNLNAQINSIDVELSKANDVWGTAKETSDILRAKANLQAALLTFLAGRGT